MSEDRAMLPVVGLRMLEGRTGSTLLMQLLGSAPDIVFDRRYPEGEYRYLSYCQRTAAAMARPLRPDHDPGVTELLFGDPDRFGPLPFDPLSLDRGALGTAFLRHLWRACSELMVERRPHARWYAEKLVYPVAPLVDAGIELTVIDLVRDPRDMLASIRSFVGRTGVDGFGIQDHGPTSTEYLEGFVQRLRQQLDEMTAEPRGFRRVTVRYEDMARDLGTCARRLGDLLDAELDPEAVASARDSMAHHITTVSVAASIGRWRSDLSEAEADRIWVALGSRLESLGYRRSG